jgi:hypothetical protein
MKLVSIYRADHTRMPPAGYHGILDEDVPTFVDSAIVRQALSLHVPAANSTIDSIAVLPAVRWFVMGMAGLMCPKEFVRHCWQAFLPL